MEYAVIKTGGKQYKVAKGEILEVDKLDLKPKDKFSFKEVLLYASDGKIKIGTPFIKGADVKAKVVENFKGDKVRIAKFKAKARYRRVRGFRPLKTRLLIEAIDIV